MGIVRGAGAGFRPRRRVGGRPALEITQEHGRQAQDLGAGVTAAAAAAAAARLPAWMFPLDRAATAAQIMQLHVAMFWAPAFTRAAPRRFGLVWPPAAGTAARVIARAAGGGAPRVIPRAPDPTTRDVHTRSLAPRHVDNPSDPPRVAFCRGSCAARRRRDLRRRWEGGVVIARGNPRTRASGRSARLGYPSTCPARRAGAPAHISLASGPARCVRHGTVGFRGR